MDISDIVHPDIQHGDPLIITVVPQFDFPMDRLPSASESSAARQAVQDYSQSLLDLQSAIQSEHLQLTQLVQQRQAHINALQSRALSLSDKLATARAYLAPIRSLPDELLAEVFLILWLTDHKVAWKLSAVNRLWRRVSLAMPKLWSAIELKTSTLSCPAEIIRLWLERSGTSSPLDIDITLVSSHRHPLFLRPTLFVRLASPGPPPSQNDPPARPDDASSIPPIIINSPPSGTP